MMETGARRRGEIHDVETSIQISVELDPGIPAFIPLVSRISHDDLHDLS